jgi:hypothetical protein
LHTQGEAKLSGSKTSRDELINDLTVYAKLLNESQPTSKSFEHVYEVLTEPGYSVSLDTFAFVMRSIPLTTFQQERLERINVLLQWTHPHIPDLAPFGALWYLTSVEDDTEIFIEVDDESTTTEAVKNLFSTNDEELIEALDHECVLVRAAAAVAGSSEEFMDALRPQLRLEDALFYGCDVDDYVYSSEFKDHYLRELENFSGNREDIDTLPEYPYTATDCRCVPSWTAIDNYFNSLQFFWLEGSGHFGKDLQSGDFAFWSTKNDAHVDDALRFHEPPFFSLALPTKFRKFYRIRFAYGPLALSFTTIPGYPDENGEIWRDSWDNRIDMIQSFLERLAGAEQSGVKPTEQRKYVWDYEEGLTDEGDVNISHRILTLSEKHDSYTTIEPIDFDSGFFYLRHELFGI